MKHDEMAGHFVGILLVLAMLSCAAAFGTGGASEPEPSAFEDNAAADAPEAPDAGPQAAIPYVAFSP